MPNLTNASCRNTATTGTFLNSPSSLKKVAALNTEFISSLSSRIGAENYTASFFLQPIPTYFSAVGQRNGGNMLGLERFSGNAILWTCGVFVLNGDEAMLAIAKQELNRMTVKLNDFLAKEETMLDFIYLNYAESMQDPLGSYGEDNVAFLKNVAQKYDPAGWWQTMVPGGFKLSRVAD
jgi:hypothetical protein